MLLTSSFAWYCSEPRLAFNKNSGFCAIGFHTWRSAASAPGTINVRLAAVRRLAYEAADAGLLSPNWQPESIASKVSRKLGSRLGNWLYGG